MKCNKCGIENSRESKFCTECGTELSTVSVGKITTDSFYCNQCGTKNTETSNFCVKCGNKLQNGKPNQRKKSSARNNHNRTRKIHNQKRLAILDMVQENKTFAVIGLVVVGFLVVLFLPNNKTSTNPRNYIPNSSTGFAGLTGSRLNDIASKFICSCGTCDELPLETCGCPTANGEKAFIQSQMNTNKSDAQIIKAVYSKYGWIKPQFKNLLSSAGETSGNSSKLISNGTKLASLFDMTLITEQFKCPCGQCNVEELKDCNCNHPRGATEVKGFITNKINENAYTVNQIISMVNKTYGGKKI